MYLKKLELIGFKSFMDKTTLNFEPGITAIVGPNGCGKSNIFDGIRWVLGEQSVKSLRGSQMEDVIFNGTDSKQGLSMAEVSLVFDNANRFFPMDNSEIVVTRRIFRSGESEYFLNKALVRLKDILELLMGTGIGAESYSLVAQGKIDLILSSRPEDRRLVFDEAAGITKYKAQKKEALRKLEETEQNLLRVSDIIAEVKRSIGYLERQANKARKYKEVFEALKTKEIHLAIAQKKHLAKQRDEITFALDQLKGRENDLLNKIKEYEISIAQRNQELKTREDSVTAIKNQIVSLENTAARTKQHMLFNQERIQELEKAKGYLEEQIGQIQARLLLDEEKLNKLRGEESVIKKNIDEKALLLKDKERQLNELIHAMKASAEIVALAKKSILDLAAKISQVKNNIVDLASKKQIFLARKKRLDIEKIKSGEEKAGVEGDLNTLNAELIQLQEDMGFLNLKVSQLNKELEEGNVSLAQLNSDVENLERQKLALQSHKEFLEKLKTQYESIDTSMNALIYLDKLPTEKITGLVVKVNTCMDLKDEEKTSLAHVKLSGEAKPIDLDAQRVTEKINQIEAGIVTLKDTKQQKEVHIEQLKQVLQAQRQLRQDKEIALSSKKTTHQAITEQFTKIKEEEELIILELSDVQGELKGLEGKLIDSETQAIELDIENKIQEALIHSEQEKASLNADLKEEILMVITKTKTEIEALVKRLGSEDSALKMLEETHLRNKENLSALTTQIKENQKKYEFILMENNELEADIAHTQKDIEAKEGYLKEEEAQYIAISEAVRRTVEVIELEKKEADVLKDKLYELQMQDKDFDFKYVSVKERIMQVYKIDLDSAMEPNTQPETVTPVIQPVTTEVIDESAFSQEIEVLKTKLDSYGTVNLVAIEEYDELKKRYDFLTQQQSDLISAKESIQDAIRKINHTTRKMFVETFEKVAEEFRNYFRLLFNGGDAKVFLLDGQDPLESGIEIICRPPGKKLQNVLLLSGGEKSLSAIALIFAIFKVKPAPFCVLDEIDAALDEANVDRFSRMFQEFTLTSQFIVITHNKRTIANANVMYGITMAESGVSKIVSVKFAEKPKQEATQANEPVAA